MAHHGRTVVGQHELRCLIDAMLASVELIGIERTGRRAMEIASLPYKNWRGKTVYRIVCQAEFGKGPHVLWVPMSLLFQLISLERFRCPYHR